MGVAVAIVSLYYASKKPSVTVISNDKPQLVKEEKPQKVLDSLK